MVGRGPLAAGQGPWRLVFRGPSSLVLPRGNLASVSLARPRVQRARQKPGRTRTRIGKTSSRPTIIRKVKRILEYHWKCA